MTHRVALGTGVGARLAVEQALAEAGPSTVVEFERFALGWSMSSPWVDVFDDGSTLVLVDGLVFDVPGVQDRGADGPAARVAARYRVLPDGVADGLLGEYVVVVLDRTRRRLLVLRDPVGVRPWYLAGSGSRVVGSSSVAGVVAVDWVDRSLDDVTLIRHLARAVRLPGSTYYRGVRTLAPGAGWWWSASGVEIRPHHRWVIAADSGTSWDDAVGFCRDELDAAVRRRSGAAVAAELSGGLDSSSVVGTLVRNGRAPLVGRLLFSGSGADERRYSDEVIHHHGLDRVVSCDPWRPSPDEIAELERMLRRPVPGPHFVMSRDLDSVLSEQAISVVLTGQGGDEAFRAMPVGARVSSVFERSMLEGVRVLASTVAAAPRANLRSVVRPALRYASPLRRRPAPAWVTPDALRRAGLPLRIVRRPTSVSGSAAVDERWRPLTSGYLAGVMEDSAAFMDLGDVRRSHPFLDVPFVQAVYGFDPEWPTRDGRSRALQTAAYADRVPSMVAERTDKAEFSDVFWSQITDDDLSRAANGPLSQQGWLDTAELGRLTSLSGDRATAAALPLYAVISLDRWLRQF